MALILLAGKRTRGKLVVGADTPNKLEDLINEDHRHGESDANSPVLEQGEQETKRNDRERTRQLAFLRPFHNNVELWQTHASSGRG